MFDHENCFIQDHSQKLPLKLLGKQQAGLYNVSSDGVNIGSTCCTTIAEAKLWHLRLGHIPFPQLKFIIPNCDGKLYQSENICQICPASRQSRMGFPHSSIRTITIFELLHLDIWGPYQTKTPSGCNYFLNVVDDFSRFTWVHLLKHKLDIVQVF